MLFCPPSELVDFVLTTLSFSGQNGLPLPKLWEEVGHKLQISSLDAFQKRVIWHWLFASRPGSEDPPQVIVKDGDAEIVVEERYEKNFGPAGANEETVRIYPSEDTQWKYLTGSDNYKQIKEQLGEYPFQLLCIIGKFGTVGVLTPELCREAGQDPRSSTSRLNKLEELGLIIKKQHYDEEKKLHTSLLVHSKFAAYNSSDNDDMLESSKNLNKLRQYIMDAVKKAPNQLRAFRDLKGEMGLDGDKSSSRLYDSVIRTLAKNGCVEKLNVQLPENRGSVLCVKYVKDLPKSGNEIADFVNLLEDIEVENDGEDEAEIETKPLPLINHVFPVHTQIFQLIKSRGAAGLTTSVLSLLLTGNKDYRPVKRILENFVTYTSDGSQLKYLRNYQDPYADQSLVKIYDFEGKFKFYRYFVRDVVDAKDAKPPLKRTQKVATTTADLRTLHRKFLKKAAIPKAQSLSTIKKRQVLVKDTTDNTPKRKRGRPRKVEVPEEDIPPAKRATLKSTIAADTDIPISGIDDELTVKTESPTQEPEPPVSEKKSEYVKPINKSVNLKAIRRREALLTIIQERGGVIHTGIDLHRQVDKILDNNTVTDAKTLARDISLMIHQGDVEVQSVTFEKKGKEVTKKLIILSDPRPSEEAIQQAKESLINRESSKKPLDTPRTIELNVEIYVDESLKRRTTRLKSLNEKGQGKGRSRKTKAKVEKVEPEESTKLEDLPDENTAKGSFLPIRNDRKRKRKQKIKKTTNGPAKPGQGRFVSSAKFSKNDATTLFRLVVIHKTMFKATLDFQQLGEFFDGMKGNILRRKWIIVRKLIGGLAAVQKGCRDFEKVILRGIENGLVTVKDLEKKDIHFFLDLWREVDSSDVDLADKTPLYSTVEQNSDVYDILRRTEVEYDLCAQLEDNSMRQKEAILASHAFSYEEDAEPVPERYDDLKTTIKAIVSTSESNFSGQQAKSILSKFEEEDISNATNELITDKDLSYFSLDDSNTRFVLTEKFHEPISTRIVSQKFLTSATFFQENLIALSEASKGLIISQGIQSGPMACFLELLSSGLSRAVRIEKPYKFESYESRLIDKEKLSCDIVAVCDPDEVRRDPLTPVPIPLGLACSRIWLDLTGNVNTQVWVKLVTTLLNYINMRPGVTNGYLHGKLRLVVSVSDFKSVMEWLVATGCVIKGEAGGYWTSPKWYTLLGSE